MDDFFMIFLYLVLLADFQFSIKQMHFALEHIQLWQNLQSLWEIAHFVH